MKLIAHQMGKDLRELKWSLAVWFACGVYLVATRGQMSQGTLAPQMFAYLVCMILVGALTCSLTAKLVQIDAPIDSTVFWRTRPISTWRLLGAKGLFVLLVFVVLPTILTLLMERKGGSFPFDRMADHLLVWTAVAVVSMALGACTKDSSRFVLIGILCVVATSALRGWLAVWTQRGGTHLVVNVGGGPRTTGLSAAGQVTALYCVLMGVAVILCQYFWQRRTVSLALVVLGVLGAAMISPLWR